MKRKLKKLWNNRKFRTFIQSFLGSIITYFGYTQISDVTFDAIRCLIISAIATGLSAIMPLLNEEGDD